jgi:hypothetical protein
LDATQKALVLNVIKTYVNDVSDTNAASILATYTSELDNTYIYYSGNTSMTVKMITSELQVKSVDRIFRTGRDCSQRSALSLHLERQSERLCND